MKKAILIIGLGLLAFAGFKWYNSKKSSVEGTQKQQPLVVMKHSSAFNVAISNAMEAYFAMNTAFVEADTLNVKENCKKFIQLLDSIPLTELKEDTTRIFAIAETTLSNIKANAQSLMKQTDILEMRKDFGMVSETLYPFFKTVHYDGEKMYWQNCPMAFDDAGANWFSKTREIVNPYMGKHHPQYRGSMLHCGEVKDSIQAQ